MVTSPKLTSQQSQQLNYMPQPTSQGHTHTSPPPSQQQPAFMHQFQHSPMQPTNQFTMMQPHFGFSLQQQRPLGQMPQQQYAQRQTSPNMPTHWTGQSNGNGGINF